MARRKKTYEVYTNDKRRFWHGIKAYNKEDAARQAGFKPHDGGRLITVVEVKP